MSKEIEDITAFHDHGLYLPSRTLYLHQDLEDSEVNHNVAARAIKNLHILEQISDAAIRIYINTPGGDVISGMAIYDAIISSPCLIKGIVLGEASSMGAIILQGCDSRVARKWARFMLHDGSNSVEGNWRDVEKAVESDRLFRLDSYRILAEATGKPAKYWQRKLANDYYLNAEQALAEGLIDEIL